MGAPIECPHVANPSQEQIDEYHDRYTTALKQLFEDHKQDYHVEADQHIRIVE